MNDNCDPVFDSEQPDEQLPPGLAAAVNQARARQPTPEMIDQLIRRASQIGAVQRPEQQPITGWIAAIVTVAAVALLVVYAILPRLQKRIDEPIPQIAATTMTPVYSAVTKRSLVDGGFHQIEADLKRAEQRITDASEAVELDQLRWDLRTTVAEYHRSWDK